MAHRIGGGRFCSSYKYTKKDCDSRLDFNRMKISFTQIKTEVPQCLELVPEVRNALREYLAKIRPNTDIQNVFLTFANSLSPLSAQTVYCKLFKERTGTKQAISKIMFDCLLNLTDILRIAQQNWFPCGWRPAAAVLFLESIIYESFRKKVALSQNLLTKKFERILYIYMA